MIFCSPCEFEIAGFNCSYLLICNLWKVPLKNLKDNFSYPLIRHFHIPHNTPCLPPKILRKHWLQFLLGWLRYPGEMENKGYVDFWGANKLHYWECGNGKYILKQAKTLSIYNPLVFLLGGAFPLIVGITPRVPALLIKWALQYPNTTQPTAQISAEYFMKLKRRSFHLHLHVKCPHTVQKSESRAIATFAAVIRVVTQRSSPQ